MRRRPVISVATFIAYLAVIALFLQYVASLGVRLGPPSHRTNLSMEVATINNMVVDASVLLRGIRVGKVTAIDATPSNATIHFYIEDQYRVPVDSDIRLENLSALGESYILLEPRSSSGPILRDGQRIDTKAVRRVPSISDLGASVVRVLNQMDPQQLSRVVHEADAGLPDPAVVLPNLARTSMLLRNMTAGFKGKGQDLLDNFQVLLQNASFVGPALSQASPSLRALGPELSLVWTDFFVKVVIGLNAGDFYTISSFLHRIQKLLDDRGTDLRVLGEATSANVKLIAAAIRNLDSGQILSNFMASVPEDGVMDLHVAIPPG
jgi:phospholipid/cholesterol/gamma-HCH transport system substrate-binding protein